LNNSESLRPRGSSPQDPRKSRSKRLTTKAATALQVDSEFKKKLETALQKLYPYQIGKKGNLQEWYYNWKDAEPQHRHQSHLFGLHPGYQIDPKRTPELANACRKTLEIRGDETRG
jgi:alpha-L-fucosidase 2